jgi:hypothetical protein
LQVKVLHWYHQHQWQICHQYQQNWLATGNNGVVDTGGKFTTSVNDTGGIFAAGVNDTLVANKGNNIRLRRAEIMAGRQERLQ